MREKDQELRRATLHTREEDDVRIRLELQLGQAIAAQNELAKQVQAVGAERDAAKKMAAKLRAERRLLSKTVRALQTRSGAQQEALVEMERRWEEKMALVQADLCNQQGICFNVVLK
jgi:hypothetical protein